MTDSTALTVDQRAVRALGLADTARALQASVVALRGLHQAALDAEDARIEAERKALAAQRAAVEPVVEPIPVAERRRPTPREMIDLLSRHFDAPPADVITWLREAFGARAAA